MRISASVIYDGLKQVGRIEPAGNGKRAIAFGSDGRRLGEFTEEAAAMRAIKMCAPEKNARR